MKVEVNYTLCEANGICAGIAPEIFELDDDDNLHLHREQVDGEEAGLVRDAVAQCPRQAIAAHD